VHDHVIVGAGTAGCVLASRLTEDPEVSVLLVEAGPPARRKLEVRIPAAFPRLYRSEVDWGLSTVPQPELDGRELVYPLGRMLGGCASMNAMIVARGHRLDYEQWAAVAPGWSWEDVEPYYERSARGPFPLVDQRDRSPLSDAFVGAAQAAGIPFRSDLNEPDNEGVGIVRVSQRRGRRFSVVDGYLRPAMRRPNLTVQTDALATRVLLEGRRAVGVAVRVNGEEEHVSASRGVVLAAGAVHSPRLLQLSGIGPADVLAEAGVPVVHELSGVGRGLRDHVASGLVVRTRPGVETLTSARALGNVLRWLLLRRGPLTSNVGEALAFVRTRPSLPAPDVELVFAPVPFEEEGLKEPTEHGVTIGVVQLQPRSVGTVRITSADPIAAPAVDPAFLREPDDVEPLLWGLRLARRIATHEPLAGYLADEMLPGDEVEDDDGLHAHIRARSQTLYHPVGSCRMGVDESSVVDPALRVHGLEGLHVVDASVIPFLPRGHTNWPTVMVAERAADLLTGASG
jgi:choline dehydrogenase